MRSIRPYSSNDVPRYTVKGTVPIGGGEASWETGDPWVGAYAFDVAVADKLQNPTTTGGQAAKPGPDLPVIPATIEARGRHAVQHLLRHLPRPRPAPGTDRSPRAWWASLAAHRAGPRVHRRLPVQHHPLRARAHAPVRRQGAEPEHRWAIVNHVRALQAGVAAAARRRTDRRQELMAPRKLRAAAGRGALAGRYDIHLGVGLGLALLGLVLFPLALRGEGAARAWQMFHVNWIYFTGLTGGSIAFAAVQKIGQRQWSGMVIRFAEAVGGLPAGLAARAAC